MPDSDNGELVEVDFAAARDPLALVDDLLTNSNKMRSELDGLRRDVGEVEAWRRWQDRVSRRTIRDLRRQLAEERAVCEPADDEVFAAVSGFGSPVSASQVATRCYRRRPTHSAVVRVGLALSRLEREGHVVRVRVEAHGEIRNRWEAVT